MKQDFYANHVDLSQCQEDAKDMALLVRIMDVIRDPEKMPLLSNNLSASSPSPEPAFDRDSLFQELYPNLSLVEEGKMEAAHLLGLLNKLVTSGDIYCTNRPLNIFVLITFEGAIAPAILKQLVRAGGCASVDRIVDGVSADSRLKHVPERRVHEGLTRLSAESVCFEVDKGFYGLI